MNTIAEKKLDQRELLSSIIRMNSALEKGYHTVEDLYKQNTEIKEAQNCSILSIFITTVRKNLSKCTEFLPENNLCENDIRILKKDSKVRVGYQQSLKMILDVAEMVMSARMNKNDLQAIFEVLKSFASIGALLTQAYPRSKEFNCLVGAVKENSNFLHMRILSCHE
jgi:hypothetical protein